MEQTFILQGETPSKKNCKIVLKNGKIIPSKRYRDWHNQVTPEIEKQVNYKNINEPVVIDLTFVHGDFVRRDSDNATSSIFDLLTDLNILKDDNWQIVREIRVHNEYDKKKPCCKIKITSLS